jgi:hypothetical protein
MQLIDKYIAAWNATDATARRRLVDEVFADGAAYTDPLAALTGRDQIDAFIAGVQDQFPGLEFQLGGPVDAHHDIVRFSWHLGPADAEPVVIGFDVAEITDGRIATVYGFLDKVPA